jgi:hypothetical protein
MRLKERKEAKEHSIFHLRELSEGEEKRRRVWRRGRTLERRGAQESLRVHLVKRGTC